MQENNERLANCGATWRLPGEATYCALRGNPVTLAHLGDAGDREGFIFAPFDTEGPTPTMFFCGTAERHALPAVMPSAPVASAADIVTGGDDFRGEFVKAHALLRSGGLAKIVLSGHEDMVIDLRGAAESLFFRACLMYRDAFVAMVSLPNGDMWLMATPEMLLRGRGRTVETMSLAGTRIAGDTSEWDAKNLREHGVVSQFIEERLGGLADNVRSEGPLTLNAGAVSHLMTRFNARLREGKTTWDAAQLLHPTPAMCGMPQHEAKAAILRIEKTAREYFSGVAGVAHGGGDVDLYVVIRCMRLGKGLVRLFSGVGLMPDSEEESEVREVTAKRETMKNVIFEKE